MTHRPSPSDSSARHEATGGYFTPLVAAKYLLLTTHSQDDTLRSTPVPAVADGDRAYFWTWSRSATRKRLQHTGWVQVAACTMGGICNYGPTLDASARPLAGAEASQARAKLAGKHRG